MQPLLTFGYQVAHIALDGTTPAGPAEVRISVAHQALVPSPPAVTGLTVQYSVNGGASWQPAAVSGAGATWDAWLDATPGSYVSLRVSATDAAGGTLTETLTRAFATQTEAAAARAARRAAAARPAAGAAGAYRPACAPVGPGQAQCFALFAPESAAASVGAATGASAASAGTPGSKGKPPAGWARGRSRPPTSCPSGGTPAPWSRWSRRTTRPSSRRT